MNNKGSLLLALIGGAAFGAAIAMLLTPHTGSVNRRIVRRKSEAIADDIIETIKEPIERFSDSVTETLDKLKADLKSRIC